jgi:hypothetical protein
MAAAIRAPVTPYSAAGPLKGVVAASDADELAVAVLVGLRSAHGDEDAGGLGDDVFDVECRDLAGSHRGGVAEQDDGPVADADRAIGVDAGHDLGEFGDGEWVGLPAGCHAHDPAQSTAHTSHDDVRGRVGQALLVVPMCDAGAVTIEGPEGEPGRGPFPSSCSSTSPSAGRRSRTATAPCTATIAAPMVANPTPAPS